MLNRIHHDAIVELQLARPPVNALNLSLLQELRGAVEEAPAAGARGIVLSGAPGMFSAGVDVPATTAVTRADAAPFKPGKSWATRTVRRLVARSEKFLVSTAPGAITALGSGNRVTVTVRSDALGLATRISSSRTALLAPSARNQREASCARAAAGTSNANSRNRARERRSGRYDMTQLLRS